MNLATYKKFKGDPRLSNSGQLTRVGRDGRRVGNSAQLTRVGRDDED